MNRQESIGGFFELEINNFGSLYHDDAIALNTGRNALEYILNCKKYTHVYIPYFTCDVILEPFKKTNTPYTFYHIDSNFLPIITNLEQESTLLYTNYFGLMKNNILHLKEKYTNLIIDNAQAFYDKPIKDTPTFYSPRKFFGLPDGGFVYFANEITIEEYPYDLSYKRCTHLLKSMELDKTQSYDEFKLNDELLIGQPIKKMSILTTKLMCGLDYEKIRKIRVINFNYLHSCLKDKNELTPFIEKTDYTCPMVYPYLAKGNNTLRNKMISKKVFTAKYWQNVIDWVEKDSFEFKLTQNTIYFPIDQRYNKNEIKTFITLIFG